MHDPDEDGDGQIHDRFANGGKGMSRVNSGLEGSATCSHGAEFNWPTWLSDGCGYPALKDVTSRHVYPQMDVRPESDGLEAGAVDIVHHCLS